MRPRTTVTPSTDGRRGCPTGPRFSRRPMRDATRSRSPASTSHRARGPWFSNRRGISTVRRTMSGRSVLVGIERGRLLEARASRPGDARAARGGAAAAARGRRAAAVLQRRLDARVRILVADRTVRRLRLRSRLARADAADDEPARGRHRIARRARAAPLRELRRRVDSRVPLPARRRRPVSRRRDGARRAGGAVASLVPHELRTAHAAPAPARLRGRDAERARLDGVRQAVRASRRRAPAARLRARPRLAARLARSAAGHRRLARGALRALVRRLHGARGPRVPAGALGRRHRDGRHLEPRDVLGKHVRLSSRGP